MSDGWIDLVLDCDIGNLAKIATFVAMKREWIRSFFATLLLGVFVSLSITVTAHVLSEEHIKHIENDYDTEQMPHHHSSSDSACILSQFIALNFDGLISVPSIGQTLFLLEELVVGDEQRTFSPICGAISLRAPPYVG